MTAEQLSLDLKDSQKKTSYDVISVFVTTKQSKEKFLITKDHLIKLCNDTLNGKLSPNNLNTISFALITSEFFHWQGESKDTEIIETVIYDWDNPDNGFDLSLKNIALWKEYLISGEYKLDKYELKRKF
ncbi:MAG: hypothetical protein IPL31_04900 [Saprospiraceae bacterium]|nr:hypothetical protein [Saprospiraceae bacterium]